LINNYVIGRIVTRILVIDILFVPAASMNLRLYPEIITAFLRLFPEISKLILRKD